MAAEESMSASRSIEMVYSILDELTDEQRTKAIVRFAHCPISDSKTQKKLRIARAQALAVEYLRLAAKNQVGGNRKGGFSRG